MTGAALIPGGNDGARPTTPVTGMLRYNNQGGTPVVMEYYDGAAWSVFGGGGSSGVDVGNVGFFRSPTQNPNKSINDNFTVAGSTLTPCGMRAVIFDPLGQGDVQISNTGGAAPPGTWRLQGFAANNPSPYLNVSPWVRIA